MMEFGDGCVINDLTVFAQGQAVHVHRYMLRTLQTHERGDRVLRRFQSDFADVKRFFLYFPAACLENLPDRVSGEDLLVFGANICVRLPGKAHQCIRPASADFAFDTV